MSSFFWMPDETVAWLRRVVPDFGLWCVMQKLGDSDRICDVQELRPEMLKGSETDWVSFELGDSAYIEAPVWTRVRGRSVLNPPSSYAIQFVPCLYLRDRAILLEGRIAMLPVSRYADPEKAKKLANLYRRLRLRMKRASDANRAIVQLLSTGVKKQWQDILVGKKIPSDGSIQLKQFTNGAVVFSVESRQQKRGMSGVRLESIEK